MTRFEVRFCCYEHNDGRARNSTVICSEYFFDLDAANIFYDKLVGYIANYTPEEFVEKYVTSGYVVSIDGIFKITEEKIR